MAQTIINDKDKGSVIRNALNAMFAELYAGLSSAGGDIASLQSALSTAQSDILALQTAVEAIIAARSPIVKKTIRLTTSEAAVGKEIIPASEVKSTQSIHVFAMRGYVDGVTAWSGYGAARLICGDEEADIPYNAYYIHMELLTANTDFTDGDPDVEPGEQARFGKGLHKGKGLYIHSDAEFTAGSPLELTFYALLLDNDPADDPLPM